MLKIENLSVFYGKIQALKDISISVNDGELVTVIGGNGAGKTTLVKAIMGLIPAARGKIFFDGTNLGQLNSWDRALHKIAYVPEGSRIFPDLSVKQNLKLGAFNSNNDNIESDLKDIYELFPRLQERENQYGGTLSGGEQQMLAIGRSLLLKPKIMLIDEMSMGLMPVLVKTLFKLIEKLRDKGIAILLIEQNANKALEISKRGYLMENGEIVLKGLCTDLLLDEKVKQAYLGG